ncbi:MAG: hypothetical protein ACOYI4_06675 [Christensenellales bacterium]|jgi:hypothetical protein
MKLDKKKLSQGVKILGYILTVASLVFLVKYFIDNKDSMAILLDPGALLVTVALGAFVTISVFLNAFTWKRSLEIFTPSKLPVIPIYCLFAKANMGKYIPGNVMQYVSRNIIGKDYNLDQKQMALSTVIELIVKVAVAALMTLVLSFDRLFFTVSNAVSDGALSLWLVVAVLVGGCAVVVGMIVYFIRLNRKQKLNFRKLFAVALYTAGFYAINMIAFILTLLLLNGGLGGYDPFMLSGYYLIAWFIGFITPGAPSGIGIREYVMLLLFVPMFPQSVILAAMIVNRVISTLGDVFAYLITFVFHKKLKTMKGRNIA